jgi:transcriptional/translational regulatory protein YebC/TACO1
MFERKGMFMIPVAQIEEDALMELALEAGADDVKRAGETYEVTCDPSVFQQVLEALTARELTLETSQIMRIPTSTVDLDADSGRKILNLMQKLDDHDDVQSVAANFNIPDEAMAEIGEG